MKKNIRLIVSYDGSGFFGWQKTASGPTIEGELERALVRILQHEVQLDAASRTDRGVHARGQPVRFFTSKEVDLRQLVRGVNAVLPPEIRVCSAALMPREFHPTLNAVAKEYHYHVCLGSAQMPMYRFYSWHVPRPMDVVRMREAAGHFVGEHDFSAFSNEVAKNPVCDVHKIEIVEERDSEFISDSMESELLGKGRLRIVLRADRFLYKMARIVVGVLVYMGRGVLDCGEVLSCFERGVRPKRAVTAPARGLFLSEVFYDSF